MLRKQTDSVESLPDASLRWPGALWTQGNEKTRGKTDHREPEILYTSHSFNNNTLGISVFSGFGTVRPPEVECPHGDL